MKRAPIDAHRARKRRRFWLIPVILLLLLAIIGLVALVSDAPARQELANLTFGEIDFAHLNDGTYTGSYTGTRSNLRDATVEVTIIGGVITDIRVVSGAADENGTPTELKNGQTILDLFSRVREAQSLHVDTISGATLTSNAHLKALELALEQAQANPQN